MNIELFKVLEEFITSTAELNQLAGVDYRENEQRIFDRAQALIEKVTV